MARTSNKYRTKHRNHQNSSLYGPLTSASASSSKRVPVKAAAAAHHFHKKRHSQPRDINAHSHFLGTRKRHDSFGRDTRIITTTAAGAVKQIPFSLRLPPLNMNTRSSSTNSKDMPPWYQTTTTTTTTKYEDGHIHTTKKSCCVGVSILQHLHSSHDGLQRLDEELRLFARYVSLTPVECRARDYVISHIDKTCRDLFSPRRRRRDEHDETEHEIAVQAFGSYATTTKQVCTFASDVDLALWGVVPPTTTENQEGTHTRFVQHETPNDAAAAALHSTYPLDKEDRVQKWKEALAELDAQETSNDDVHDERDLVVEHPPSASSSVATKNGDSSGMMMVEVVAAKNDAAADTTRRNDDESVVDHGGLSQKSPPSTIVNVSQQRGATTTTSTTTGANAATTTNDDDDGGATTRIEVVVAKTDDTLLAVAETNAAPVVEIAPAVAKNLNVTTTTKEQSLTEDDPPPPNANEQDSLLFVIDRVGDEAAAAPDAAVVPEPDTHQTEPLLPETRESKPNKPEAQLKSTKQQATTTVVEEEEENETQSKSDADSADKLESYASRVATRHCNDSDDDSDEQEGPFVSLSDSEQDDDFQVSFVVSQRAAPPVSSTTTTAASSSSVMVGPQGETRKLVLGALKRLGRQLWKSPVIHTVEVRKHARVPIIATGTHLGFESDIALGGHNGTDTSQYASTQAQRFKR
jgi:hypothetical protein